MPQLIEALYTWTEVDPSGGEGTIACMVPSLPDLGIMTLITRNRQIAKGPMRQAAVAHRRASGHKVRLVRWTGREDLEEL